MNAPSNPIPRLQMPILLLCVSACAGCGTTKWSDTSRTATEQLVVSGAIDSAISQMNVGVLSGRKVFLDTQFLESVDKGYLISTLRQHLMANGCLLQESRENADCIVEARSGAVGTDRHDLVFGVPQVNVPAIIPTPGIPTSIPEIPLAKKTKQIGVVKMGVFAYEKDTGYPIWQSGIVQETREARDVWLFGAGPFQSGPVREGTEFAGTRLRLPFIGSRRDAERPRPPLTVSQQAVYARPKDKVDVAASKDDDSKSEIEQVAAEGAAKQP